MKKRVLFITTQFPYPAYGGGKLVTLEHLKILTQYYSVDLVSKTELVPEQDVLQLFAEKYHLQHLKVFRHWIKTRHNLYKALITLLKANVKRLPFKILKHFNTPLESYIDTLIRVHTYDFIVYDQLPSFQPCAFHRKQAKSVMFTHNAEFESVISQLTSKSNPLKRWVLKVETRRLKKYEEMVYQTLENVVFLSGSDASQFRGIKNKISLPAYARIFESGWNVELRKIHSKPVLFMVASWSWALNIEGLLWVTQHVLQLLNSDVELWVAGDGISNRLKKKLERNSHIRILGKVADLETYYERSDMVLVPLFGGSGIKIKVVDAMAQGIPIITTSHGIQGLKSYTQGICVADTAIDYARYIDTLVENDSYYKEKQVQIRRDYQHLRQQPVAEKLLDYLNHI